MLFAVHHLIDGRTKPLSVQKTEHIDKVLSLMTEHDFSQIPIVDETGHPAGIVTLKSILRAAHSLGFKVSELDLKVVIEKARTIKVTDDLHELLNQTKRNESVLVVDEHGQLTGILTHYDTTHFFRKRIEDMLLVEDIEKMVKELIQWLYAQCTGDKGDLQETIDAVTNPARQTKPKFDAALNRYLGRAGITNHKLQREHVESAFECLDIAARNKGFEELTLSDYTEVLILHPKCPKFGPKGDKTDVRRVMTSVRDIRNKLMHFRGEVTAQEREKLRGCKKWFEGMEIGLIRD